MEINEENIRRLVGELSGNWIFQLPPHMQPAVQQRLVSIEPGFLRIWMERLKLLHKHTWN